MNTASNPNRHPPDEERFGVDRVVAVMVMLVGVLELAHQVLRHQPWGAEPTVALVLTMFALYSLIRSFRHSKARAARRDSHSSAP